MITKRKIALWIALILFITFLIVTYSHGGKKEVVTSLQQQQN